MSPIAEIVAKFSEGDRSVVENVEAPGREICIDIISGTVGPNGLVINVMDNGGSATGKKHPPLLFPPQLIVYTRTNSRIGLPPHQ